MARVSFEDVKRVGIALAWLLLFAAISIGIIIGASELVPGWGGQRWFIARNGAFGVLGFGVATWVVGKLLYKYSWERMGWRTQTGTESSGWLPHWLRGAGLGVLMAALAVGMAYAFDGASVRVIGNWGFWFSVSLPLGIGLLLAALGEELAFRGYPLRRLADAIGRLPAMLLLAILFGLAHARNPNATVLSTVNVGLAAIWLSFGFFSPGGMALAWGAHFGWNSALAIGFDAPVSGYKFQVPAVEYTPGTHAWVDGGVFGPEGGIVSTIVLIAGTLAIIGKRIKQPRTWLAG